MTHSSQCANSYNPKVHILLPVHNRRQITLQFIDSVKKQSYKCYHLVLIDDGSTDGTARSAQERLEDITIIRGNGNWWWGGSLQQGHNWLEEKKIPEDDFVLVMNDDTGFTEDFIETGVNILKDKPKTILTATGHNMKNGQPQDSGGYKFMWKNFSCVETYDCSEMNCLSTRGMMLRVGDFLDIGGFYPRLIPHYLSDLEFTMRAWRKGFRLMVHKHFKIYIDFEATGYREIKDESVMEFLKKLFSKRSASNPIYWSNFILLQAPWRYKAVNVARIWNSVYRQGVVERLLPVIKRKIGIAR